MSQDTPQDIVIIGGGLAGANAAEQLRTDGWTGGITLIAGEDHLPYERPPLSKEILLGKSEPDSVYAHDADWYSEHDIDVRTGTTASALDLKARTVRAGEETIGYDKLLLATGARSRHLRQVDDSGAPVAYLRTVDESTSLKEHLTEDVLIIGAGWIGLEVASAIRQAGGTATVVDMAAQPLGRVLGDELGEVFAELHRSHGVDLHLSTSVESVTHDDSGTTVRLADGHVTHPDLVLVAIGAEPATELAADAGLEVEGGVLVDAALRTSDPNVWAAGDIAAQQHPTLGRLRVEHWDTSIHQGRHAASSMLGKAGDYDKLPFFFSDQYDLGMEYVGHVGPDGYDEVVIRGDRDSRVLNALWIKDGTVVAGMHANDWDATDSLRAWLGRTATEKTRDTSISLADSLA